ncbi:MAG TPA: sugar ABC transporter permease [Phototrophicaceae bacterium]|jgi:ABC-type maltose transport system permease subunit|nr:sugar ABC transporter permease [Phototrophicaceae bacterium]
MADRSLTQARPQSTSVQPPLLNFQQRRLLGYAVRYLIAALLIVFAFIPVVWVVSASFNTSGSLVSIEIIPAHAGIDNYRGLLENNYYPYTTWLFNSFKIAGISTFLSVLSTAVAAYALSRFRFYGRQQLMRAILIVNVFPGILSMIALYSIMQQLGNHISFLGLDSHASLILIYTSGAMSINVFLVKGYMDSIPIDIDESALVDGATHGQIFRQITLPLAKPILVTISVLTFMAIYGDFILPRVLLQSADQLTVMVGLYLFQSADYAQNWGVFTAGAIVAALPVLVIYLLLQNYIIGGLTAGAVKL